MPQKRVCLLCESGWYRGEGERGRGVLVTGTLSPAETHACTRNAHRMRYIPSVTQ